MKPRAIVTGAAGFLGSHLVDRLLTDGWMVLGIDNLSSGRLENLALARERQGFQFRRADLRRKLRLPPATAIFHLASPASPPRYEADPIGTLEVNAFGTAQVLAHAVSCGARVLVSSTSEVYGDPQVHPQPESYWGHVNPIGVRSCYDEGKRFLEALCAAWQRQRGADVRIARIFNTYGPRMAPDDGRVVSNFFVQGWRGAPITVQGTGRQSRSFCYVDDLIEGLVRLYAAPPDTGPVNLGNPRGEATVLQLATRIRRLTGDRSPIVFVPRAADDPERRRPDLRKARRILDWEPKVPLATGLSRTSEYFHRLADRRGR
ncbi:MAG: SDR family oxidoreductase [Thermoplasmata archaeon]|nr:SDR family oxidoreductase [Thermoplasmata archaeon]